jgi:hypothetical protein
MLLDNVILKYVLMCFIAKLKFIVFPLNRSQWEDLILKTSYSYSVIDPPIKVGTNGKILIGGIVSL